MFILQDLFFKIIDFTNAIEKLIFTELTIGNYKFSLWIFLGGTLLITIFALWLIKKII